MNQGLERPYGTKGFGLFRIVFHAHWLCLLASIWPVRDLIYDQIYPIQKVDIPMDILLFASAFCSLFMLIGLFTRYVCVANYILFVIITFANINYHTGAFYDDLLKIGSLGCIFLPVSRSYSIDALISEKSMSDATWGMNRILFLFISLGLLYLGSACTKLYSDIWLKGIGLWVPMSVPTNNYTHISKWVADYRWLITALNYLVVCWEFLFPLILLCIPKWHVGIAAIGILFHIGIACMFPFPLVSLGPLAFYLLFIPFSPQKGSVDFSNRKINNNRFTLTYLNRKRLFIAFSAFLLCMQLFVSAYKFYFKQKDTTVEMTKRFKQQEETGYRFSLKPSRAIRTFFGINGRGLFLDHSFSGTKTVYAVVYVHTDSTWTWLPYYNCWAMPEAWNQNIAWAKNAYHLISLPMNAFSEDGLKKLTYFWMQQNNIHTHHARFRVLSKDITYPKDFEAGHRQKQEALPWKMAGWAEWDSNQFSFKKL